MMKKLLMMAAIAALSSSAWASATYTLDIWDIDQETLPQKIRISLYDGNTSLMSDSLDLSAWADAFGRVDVGELLKQREFSSFNKNKVVFERDSTHGIVARYVNNDVDFSFPALPEGRDENEFKSQYAKDNLKAVLTAEGSSKGMTVGVNYTPSTTATLGSSVEFAPVPVPEPTSGMFVLLGVVGLMLRRRRAA